MPHLSDVSVRPRSGFFCVGFAAWSLLLLVAPGCDRSAAPTANVAVAEPGPEEKFDNVLQLVREGVGDSTVAAGSAAPLVPGGPQPQWTTRVEHKLIPPAVEGSPFRAVVTIRTTGSIMVRVPDPEPIEVEERGRGAGVDPSADPLLADPLSVDLAAPGADPLGPITRKRPKPKSPLRSPIQMVDSESEREFELRYVDNRWELVTELSPTDRDDELYYRTFERALRLQ